MNGLSPLIFKYNTDKTLIHRPGLRPRLPCESPLILSFFFMADKYCVKNDSASLSGLGFSPHAAVMKLLALTWTFWKCRTEEATNHKFPNGFLQFYFQILVLIVVKIWSGKLMVKNNIIGYQGSFAPSPTSLLCCLRKVINIRLLQLWLFIASSCAAWQMTRNKNSNSRKDYVKRLTSNFSAVSDRGRAASDSKWEIDR